MKLEHLTVPVCAFFSVVLVGMWLIEGQMTGVESECDKDFTAEPSSVLTADDVRALMPSDWDVLPLRRVERGWSQTGMIGRDIAAAFDEVSGIMAQGGYSLRQRVPEGEIESTVVAEFANSSGGGRVLWSLWSAGGGKTCYSWGIPK